MKIRGTFGEWYDSVTVDGEKLDPKPSQEVFNHSPDGFAWGYPGSGPSQLALAILLHAGLTPRRAVRLHQRFKDRFVVAWPQGQDFEEEVNVGEWADKQESLVYG